MEIKPGGNNDKRVGKTKKASRKGSFVPRTGFEPVLPP